MKGFDFLVIAISANERKIIAEQLPNIHVRRTVKQKSKRHKYYMEESKAAMRLLRNIRQNKSN